MNGTDFFKVSATQRQDQVIKLSDNSYLLIFGYGKENEDDEQGYNFRKYYDHSPSELELKEDITTLIDKCTDERILTGFQWNGSNVYLSQENQMNFKAAYDLAVQTQGATLPIKFKLGEDADCNPIYHTFSELTEFTDFYTKAVSFIVATLNEGWEEKDSINYLNMIEDE